MNSDTLHGYMLYNGMYNISYEPEYCAWWQSLIDVYMLLCFGLWIGFFKEMFFFFKKRELRYT